jgi:hypothetical protein
MKLSASIMKLTVTFLCTPIVSIAITPLYRQSLRTKVEPLRFSISKEMLSRRHMWKKVLYWIAARPGW